MKILLANPPCKTDTAEGYEKYFIRAGSRWPHSAEKKKGDPPYHLPFPFYLGYTAAVLRQDNHDVQVLDAVALDWSEAVFIEQVTMMGPDLVLFETTTPTFAADLGMALEIKNNIGAAIVLAGAHVTTFPEKTLAENPQVDFVVLGEYEFAFRELAHRLKKNESVEGLSGIAYRENDRVVLTDRFPEINPLDQLPYPAYDLFPSNTRPDIYRYWDGISLHRKTIQMHASRGCPYRCNYCLWIQVIYGSGKYRMFSPLRIVDEMAYLVSRFGAKEIYFDDDDFTINKKQVSAICDEIRKRDLQVKWSIMGDAINPDEDLISRMASAGCIAMKFGVESGNPDVLKKLGKPVNLERVKKVAGWCARYGIRTHATFTFGLLGEDHGSMADTLAFAKALDVDTVQFSINTPFPGTRYYKMAVKQGLMKEDAWKNFDGECSAVLNLPGLSAGEIQDFHRRAVGAWLRYKLRQPAWIRRQAIYFFNLIRYQGWGKLFGLVRRVATNLFRT